MKMTIERDPGRCSAGVDVFYPNAPLCAEDGPEADVWTWGHGGFQTDRIKGLERSIKKAMTSFQLHDPAGAFQT
jgi:hypothetical protein